MIPNPLRLVGAVLLIGSAALAVPTASASDRSFRVEKRYFGKSLEEYCRDITGRTNLTQADLVRCDAQYSVEVKDFMSVEDEEAEPQARAADLPDDDLDADEPEDLVDEDDPDRLDSARPPSGKSEKARKKDAKKAAKQKAEDLEDEEPDDFDFEGDAAPPEHEEEPHDDLVIEPESDDEAAAAEEQDLTEFEGKQVRPGSTQVKGKSGGSASVPSVQLDVVGKKPLAGNYEPKIVAVERDAVVVEMPVLLGRSRQDFDGITYWVVSEVYVDGKKVAENRQQVTSASLAEFGPSFLFVKMLAPVPAKTGNVEIRVSKATSVGATKTEPLFTKTLPYTLP